ncbi:hypothetical protein ACH5RR_041544 [Cinchona calisaya]|uniref:Uncharacterized protein n=1 Tax=Cinchona calisaya TaxID=153742 RepID=A0ABD2XZ43_9GENT
MSFCHPEILFEKLIKPSSPTPDHLKIFKLSFLDQLPPPLYQTLLYYYRTDDYEKSINPSEFSKRLQESLSLLLTRFYPLAGRISRTESVIDSINCQDQGVQYRETRLDCQIKEFLREAYEDINLLTLLAPRKIIEDVDDLVLAPLVGVQVSNFSCGALVLAVQILHIVADGFTAFTFTSEWAKISKFEMMSKLSNSVNFDEVGSILPTIDISRKIKPFSPHGPEVKTVTKRFMFDEATISRLKDEVMITNSSSFLERQPTKVEVVTAFIWRSLIHAAQARHGYLRPSLTSLSENLRGKKTAIEFPQNAFGNVYIPVLIKFMPDDSSKMGLHDFVFLIRDAIKKTMLDLDKAKSKEDLYSIAIGAHNEMREWSSNDKVDARFAAILSSFPLYDEADFGWGKPFWVSTGRLLPQTFMLVDTAMGKGIEAWVNVDEIEMLKLQSDSSMAALISQF